MRKFAKHAYNQTHPEVPTPEMNTTPLIDVMLVLLVMVMLSVPMTTHSTGVILPQDKRTESPPLPVVHIAVDFLGAMTINERPVTLDPENQSARARAIDAALASIDPNNAELRIWGDELAPYDRMVEVMAGIQRSGIDRVGFVGNARFVKS